MSQAGNSVSVAPTIDGNPAHLQPGLWLPPDWGRFWKPKRNLATSARATIAIVGDSVARGYYASNLNGWGSLLRAALQASYGDGGSGFQGVGDTAAWMNGKSVAVAAVTAYGSQEPSITGTWTTPANVWGPGTLALASTVANSTLTFTVRGSAVDIYYLTNAGLGNINWTIDGIAQTPIATAGAFAVAKTTVGGLSNGSHTVVLTTAGTAGVYICGVSGYNNTGVTVNNFSVYGGLSTYFTDQGGTLPTATWSGGPSYPADLIIHSLGLNDANTNVTADAWQQNVRQYLDTLLNNAANPQTDLLLVLNHVGKYDNATPQYDKYAARIRGIAEAYGAGLLNLWRLGRNSWGYWNSLGYWAAEDGSGNTGASTVHPSDAGHRYIASQLLPIVSAA